MTDYPAFYSYAYPAPDGYGNAEVGPSGAFFSGELINVFSFEKYFTFFNFVFIFTGNY